MKTLSLLPCVALLAGCPLLDVKVEVSEACVTETDIAVPGAPDAAAIDQDFTFSDLGPIHDLLALGGSLEFVRAEVHATSGVTSLDFVDAAHVTIASGDPDSTLPTLDAYDCDGDCNVDDGVALTAAARGDILDYVAASSLVGHAALVGKPPATAWTMAVTACMKGELSKSIGP